MQSVIGICPFFLHFLNSLSAAYISMKETPHTAAPSAVALQLSSAGAQHISNSDMKAIPARALHLTASPSVSLNLLVLFSLSMIIPFLSLMLRIIFPLAVEMTSAHHFILVM